MGVLLKWYSYKIVYVVQIFEIDVYLVCEGVIMILVGGYFVKVGVVYVVKYDFKLGGYYVCYVDGYEFWLLVWVFEDGYSLVIEMLVFEMLVFEMLVFEMGVLMFGVEGDDEGQFVVYFGVYIRDCIGLFSDYELLVIIEWEIILVIGLLLGIDGGGDLVDQCWVVLDVYYGQFFGDEVEGESQVVLIEVMDVIEWVLLDFFDIFLVGDWVCEFKLQVFEDEVYVDQVIDYINYLFLKENGGFKIFYDWFKDVLLQKNGFVKVWWDDILVCQIKIYWCLIDDEVVLVFDDDDVEWVLEQEIYEDEIEIVDLLIGELGKLVFVLIDLWVEWVVEKGCL